jgi:exonuclease III
VRLLAAETVRTALAKAAEALVHGTAALPFGLGESFFTPVRRLTPMLSKQRLSTALLVFCFILFPFSAALAQTATVASWNIKGIPALSNQRADRVANAIRNLNPDVIVLEEVTPESIAPRIKNQLTGYNLSFRHQTATQSIVILSKTAVSVTNPRLIAGSNDGNPGLRKALAANVKIGQFDFILIGVHMKANRPGNTSNPNDPQRVRTREAQAIANFIRTATQGAEKDVMVVGDYNMVPGEDDVNFRAMSPGTGSNEFLRYISTESLVNEVSHIKNCTGGQPNGNLLDGWAISKNFTGEYVADSLEILNVDNSIFGSLTCGQYTSNLSDHLLLLAKFRTGADDD